jgi:hypothetical protein
MIKDRCNIIIIGTLSSGSSALVDMLKEYETINVLPREFDDFRRPGFVYDQLSFDSSRDYPSVIDSEKKFENNRWEQIYKSSIWKFFASKGLENIWKKDWKYPKLIAYKHSLINLFQIHYLKELNKSLKADISFDEKIRLSNEWIKQIGNIYPSKFDYTLFNQPLMPWFDTKIWTKVFDPFKLICVIREPKDQLAEMVKRDIPFSPFRDAQLTYGQFNITSIYGNDRKGRMKFLTDALKKRVAIIEEWQKEIGADRFMLIDFEGLANKYDDYKPEIEQFLGISNEQHLLKKTHFNPDVALKNSIGIFSSYLNKEEIEDLAELEAWYKKKIKPRGQNKE